MRSVPAAAGFEAGQAVSTIPAFSMTSYAIYGELVIAPAHAVVAHPPALGFAEAAAVWMQYLTAWGGLVDIARLQARDVVLVPAASSSVGPMAGASTIAMP